MDHGAEEIPGLAKLLLKADGSGIEAWRLRAWQRDGHDEASLFCHCCIRFPLAATIDVTTIWRGKSGWAKDTVYLFGHTNKKLMNAIMFERNVISKC